MSTALRDPDRLSVVGRVGRYVGVLLLCLLSWGLALPTDPENVPDSVAGFIFLDILVGLLAIGFLPFRRRFPLGVAAVTSLLLLISDSVTGPWLLATVSLGTRRRVMPSILVVVIATAASVIYGVMSPLAVYSESMAWWELMLFALVTSMLVTAVGFYIGARRDLVRTLWERAETAEREQATRASQARVAERSRIAREMHDALAHRISTVAMHSGALAYRDDLSRDQVQSTAQLIQENAHSALVELRDILGVLRDDADASLSSRTPEPPQPTLADLPRLVTESVDAGQLVQLDLEVDSEQIPPLLGRHLYRSVQECLTNARKHAPGAPVHIRIARTGNRDAALMLEASNPLTPQGHPPEHDLSGLFATLRAADGGIRPAPSSGVGLLGLAERADLAGGTLEHGPEGGRYVTRLTVPWPERNTS